jgi:hypothetical protein
VQVQVGEASSRTLLGHEDVTARASFYRYRCRYSFALLMMLSRW